MSTNKDDYENGRPKTEQALPSSFSASAPQPCSSPLPLVSRNIQSANYSLVSVERSTSSHMMISRPIPMGLNFNRKCSWHSSPDAQPPSTSKINQHNHSQICSNEGQLPKVSHQILPSDHTYSYSQIASDPVYRLRSRATDSLGQIEIDDEVPHSVPPSELSPFSRHITAIKPQTNELGSCQDNQQQSELLMQTENKLNVKPLLRRRWRFPNGMKNVHDKMERELILYYLRAPASFYLLLVVSARNLAQTASQNANTNANDGSDLLNQIIETGKATLEREDGRPCTFSPQLMAGPSLVLYSPPLKVTPSFNLSLPRVSLQNVPPFEYVIGRSNQSLEHVPAIARRWFSRRHCVIQVHPARFGRTGEVLFILKDLRSANGTFLNGRAIPPGCSIPLHSGDLIGVSMTDGGAFMMGFRFLVNALAERTWLGEPVIDELLDEKNRVQALVENSESIIMN